MVEMLVCAVPGRIQACMSELRPVTGNKASLLTHSTPCQMSTSSHVYPARHLICQSSASAQPVWLRVGAWLRTWLARAFCSKLL